MEEETEAPDASVRMRTEPGPYGLDRPVYTVARCAAILGVSKYVVRGRIQRGEMEAEQVNTRWRIPRAAVARWLDERPLPGERRR